MTPEDIHRRSRWAAEGLFENGAFGVGFRPSEFAITSVTMALNAIVADAIRAAVLEEREACAILAEAADSGSDDWQRGSDGRNIAWAIRARKE